MYLAVAGNDCVLIDPVDAPTAIAAARDTGATSFHVFTTHGHPDHAAGNAEVKAALGCEVIGSALEPEFGWEYDKALDRECVLQMGGIVGFVLHLPGHTPGHLGLVVGNDIFIGDVLFVGGIGNCKFGGDPGALYATIRDQLPKAPDSLVFYSGHDYAKRNWEFILSVEPTNETAAQLLEEHAAHTRADGPIIHTIGKERGYNPFVRTGDPELRSHILERYPEREATVTDPGERAFRILRGLRDEF